MYRSFPSTLLFHFGYILTRSAVEPYHKIRAQAVLRTRYTFKSSNLVVFEHLCVLHGDFKAGACSGVKVFWIIFTFFTDVLNSWLVSFGCHFEWLFKYWWIDFIFTGYFLNNIINLKNKYFLVWLCVSLIVLAILIENYKNVPIAFFKTSEFWNIVYGINALKR